MEDSGIPLIDSEAPLPPTTSTNGAAPLCEVELGTAIDASGLGRYHARALLVAALCWSYVGCAVTAEPFFLRGMIERLELSDYEAGSIAASRLAGCILGNLAFGWFADSYGRVPAVAGGLFMKASFNILGAFKGGGMPLLLVSRFLVGMSGAGVLMTMNTYFAEISPSAYRGRLMALVHIFWPLGIVIAMEIVPFYSGDHWRMLMLVTGSPGFLLAPFVVCAMWESPRYLLITGQRGKAEESVRTMAFMNGVQLEDLPDNWTLADIPPPTDKFSSGFSAVVSGRFLCGTTLPLWVCFFCLNYASQGTFLWLPEYMRTIGISKDQVHMEYIWIAASEVLAVVVSFFMIDSGQRRYTLCAAFFFAGACMIGAVSHPDEHALVLVCFVGVTFWEEIVWACLYIVTGEAYPSAIRNTAAGLAMGPNRVGGVISSLVGRDLMGTNPALPFLLHGAALIVGAIAALFMSADYTGKKIKDQL